MANGCRSSFTYNVSQPDELLTQVSVSNNVSCYNDTNGSVIAIVSGGTPGISILWSNGSQTFANSNLPAGNYSYTVTDATGCTAGSAVDARCFGDQNGSIIVSGIGGTTNFNAYEFSIDSINWQTGDLFPGLGAGTYEVYVRDNNGCVISDSVLIEAADPFSITFFSPQDTTIEYGDSISLAALVSDSSGALVSWWDVNANTLIVESVYDLTVTPANTTIYEFRAISPLGCESDSSVVISVTKPRRAAAPGGFTPNGDGANDNFFIQGDDKVSKVLIFKVYDRWGELIFSAENIAPNDAAAGWDGTFKGEKMNSGVYAWYAEVQYIDGFKELLKGDVTLLR
jgi:gliding motility-associated-like protein